MLTVDKDREEALAYNERSFTVIVLFVTKIGQSLASGTDTDTVSETGATNLSMFKFIF